MKSGRLDLGCVQKWLCRTMILAWCLWAIGLVCEIVAPIDRPPSRILQKQSGLFYLGCQDLFGDYRMPRICAAEESPYSPASLPRRDACYPAMALMLVSCFPKDSYIGGALFGSISIIVFLISVTRLMGARSRTRPLLTLSSLCMTSVFMFSVERANMVMLAVSCVIFFLAYYRDPRWTLRVFAVLALSMAVVLKISPAIFGMLLLRDRQWKELALFVGFSLLLLILPFFAVGGWPTFVQWMENAAENNRLYACFGSWGGAPIGRLVRYAQELPLNEPWQLCRAYRAPFVGFGVLFACIALAWCMRLRRVAALSRFDVLLLLVLAMLLLPGNMLFYTGLYLVPVWVLWLERKMRYEALFAIGIFLVFQPYVFLPTVGSNVFNQFVASTGVSVFSAYVGLRVFHKVRFRSAACGSAAKCS